MTSLRSLLRAVLDDQRLLLAACAANLALAILVAGFLVSVAQPRYEALQYNTQAPFRFDVILGVYEAWIPEQGWIVVTPAVVER
jgi:hypothetical protein